MNIIRHQNFIWVDIKNPIDEDMEWLKRNFNLHPLVLKELLPPLDYPKVENFGDYLFIVLFYPFFDKETFQTIPFELDIIVSKDYLISSHHKDIVPLKAIFDQCNIYEEGREEYFKDGPGLLLFKLIQEVFKASFPKLSHIKENVSAIEEAVFRGKYRETMNNISLVERDIIGFERIIEPQKLAIMSLTKEVKIFFNKKTLPYFHTLENLYDQVQNMLKTQHKILKALKTTNESLLANRTNEIMKILTIFSVVVLPLTLIASIFGMNTNYLPFWDKANDFFIVLLIMAAVGAAMLLFFRGKKWL